MAADMAVKAPSQAGASNNWTGFYVGLNAGADVAYSGDPTTSASCVAAPGFAASYFACADIPAVNAVGTGSMSSVGFSGGAQAGYNWQFNSTVVGVETDFENFHGNASRTATGPFITLPANALTISSSVNANWLFTARARLGWAFNSNMLAYATGGLAVTHLSAANAYSDNIGVPFVGVGAWSASATKVGYALGAGAEYALTQHWSVRAEYLYVHFDAITASGVVVGTALPGGYGSAITTSTDLSAHIARAGIDYKF
jgi:outer membrane immunogenic protein